MKPALKIESISHPPLRRQGDRIAAVSLVIQRVEREHAGRLRRIAMLLAGAAALLIINGILVAFLS
jgi:hypothetical protein